ncbi:MAG: TonB-dependent receptor, partial [Gemmatimonadota bacterium]|nr:TonB-dependent receptor [Gemmatimonadota bacterium]
PNVLGGVIEMDVADDPTAPDRTTVRVTGGVDHVGGFGTSGTLEVPIETEDGGWLLRGGVGYRDSPGQPLASGVTEPVPTEDDLRLNTDVDQIDGFFSTRYGSDGGAWVSLMGTGFSAERGIAAELGADEPRFWRYPDIRRTIAVASAGTGDRETPLGRGGISASFGYDDGHTEIESYTSRAYDQIDGTEIGDDRTWTGRALGQHSMGDMASLRMAFTYADILRDQNTDGLLETFQQRLWSLGTEANLRLLDDADAGLQSLQLTLGGAIDRASTPQSGGRPPLDPLTDWGGRAGLTGVLSDGNLLLHGGVSRRVRFPALRELYSEALGEFAANPDLEPERLVAIEVGSTMRVAEGEVQLVGFHHDLTGAIRRITLDDGRRQRVNADRLRSTGLEVLASQDFGPLSLTGDLTLQAVDLIDPNTSVSTEPENLPQVAGEIAAGMSFGAGFSGTFEAQYTGTQYCQDPDTGADRELDDGTWLNAGLAKRFSLGRGQAGTISGVELSAFVRNLGDIELDDQCGLPRPGRLFGLQVSVF